MPIRSSVVAPSSASVRFGALLRHFRKRAGLTQRKLAEVAHLSERTISDLERGINSKPQGATFEALADAFDLNPAERALLERAALLRSIPAAEFRTLEARSGPPPLPPLVGRARELAVLERHLAGEGPPLLVFVGEPGIGKTRLRQEAAMLAPAGGWQVVEGSCTRQGGQQAYTPFATMVAKRLDKLPDAQRRACLARDPWLALLLPELLTTVAPADVMRALSAEQERRLMFAAVGRLLAGAARSVGTLLTLENLQWAGSDALTLLDSLIRQTQNLPLRFIGTYRDTDVAPADPLAVLLADLEDEGLAHRIALDPLSLDESTALVQALLPASARAGGDGSESSDWMRHVVQRSGGLPLFVVSYVQALLTSGAEAVKATIPTDVVESIRQRVAVLPSVAQTILRIASVALGEISPAIVLSVASTMGMGEDASLEALALAHHSRLLVVTAAGGYQFGHDLMREVVERDMGPAHNVALHRRMAEALERLPRSQQLMAELAWHFTEAGEGVRALGYLLQAGDHAVTIYAYSTAERYYRTALELARRVNDQAQVAETRMRLAQFFLSLARYDDALAQVEQAAAIYRARDDRAGQEWAAAQCALIQVLGDTEEQATEHTLRMLESLETQHAPQHVTEVYSAIFYHYFITGRYREVVPFLARRIAALARTANLDRSLAQALARAVPALLVTGWSADALRTAEETIPRLEAAGELTALTQLLHLAALMHADAGNFVAARRYIEQAAAIVERANDDPAGPAFLGSVRARLAFFSGAWDEARNYAEQSVAHGRQVDPSHGLVIRALISPLIELGRIRLAEGAIGPARAALAEAIAAVEHPYELPVVPWAYSLRAECDLAEGNAYAARDRLRPIVSSFALVEWGVTMALPTLAESQVELGEWTEADDLLMRGVACARGKGERVTLVELLRVQAVLRSRQERWQEAVDILEEDLTVCREIRCPYAEAKALYAYGQLHEAKGEPDLARGQYEAALAICVRLGEGLYRLHIERSLAALDQAATP